MRWLALLALTACGRFAFDARDGGGSSTDADAAPVAARAQISAGNSHTCLIRGTTLYCFGWNVYGQLGQGDVMDRDVPAPVAGEWLEVAAIQEHTCAITTAGDVSCWGNNSHGELGVGDTAPRLTPTPVALPARARHIDATSFHTCALLEDGRLFGWGENGEGQLGQNDMNNGPDYPSPVAISTGTSWTDVACGYAHTIGSESGVLSGTGRNAQYQLGLGDTALPQYRILTPMAPGPWQVVAGGEQFSCGISGGALYCWGQNNNTELGTGDATPHSLPFAIDSARPWLDVDVDTFGGCAVTTANDGWCWGRNVEGQLGTGDSVDHLVPTPTGSNWRSISVGRFHACGERTDGTFWCTGQGANGRLGIGPAGIIQSWTQVMLPAVHAA
jgi:alpha-tubulin suppressor-like RCC1 family protein